MFAAINRNLLGPQTLKEKIKSGADFILRIWGVSEPREQAPEGWLDSVSILPSLHRLAPHDPLHATGRNVVTLT